jgi:hypothetical protein
MQKFRIRAFIGSGFWHCIQYDFFLRVSTVNPGACRVTRIASYKCRITSISTSTWGAWLWVLSLPITCERVCDKEISRCLKNRNHQYRVNLEENFKVVSVPEATRIYHNAIVTDLTEEIYIDSEVRSAVFFWFPQSERFEFRDGWQLNSERQVARSIAAARGDVRTRQRWTNRHVLIAHT